LIICGTDLRQGIRTDRRLMAQPRRVHLWEPAVVIEIKEATLMRLDRWETGAHSSIWLVSLEGVVAAPRNAGNASEFRKAGGETAIAPNKA
jgi:hypothetical protein